MSNDTRNESKWVVRFAKIVYTIVYASLACYAVSLIGFFFSQMFARDSLCDRIFFASTAISALILIVTVFVNCVPVMLKKPQTSPPSSPSVRT
jgi:hypothetical protein